MQAVGAADLSFKEAVGACHDAIQSRGKVYGKQEPDHVPQAKGAGAG